MTRDAFRRVPAFAAAAGLTAAIAASLALGPVTAVAAGIE